jgi:Protein of unknown function (DUF3592)
MTFERIGRLLKRRLTPEHLSLEQKSLLVFLAFMWVTSVGIYCSRSYRVLQWDHATGTVMGKKSYKSSSGSKNLYNPVISFDVSDSYKNEHGKVKTRTSSYQFTSKVAVKENSYSIGSQVEVMYNDNNRQRAALASRINKEMKHASAYFGLMSIVALLGLAALWKSNVGDAYDYDDDGTVGTAYTRDENTVCTKDDNTICTKDEVTLNTIDESMYRVGETGNTQTSRNSASTATLLV